MTETNTPSPEAAGSNPAQAPTELETAQAEASEAEKKYVYLYAEFENFKKRAVKERQEATQFGWEPVARDLLGVLDNLERAVLHMPATTDPTLKAGIEMVAKQFAQTLEKRGVQEVKALGLPFDPNFQEAVGQDFSSEFANGSVHKVETKGFTLHGRLLRPARVLVSMGARPQG
jgi:molecular chaperone GrpE